MKKEPCEQPMQKCEQPMQKKKFRLIMLLSLMLATGFMVISLTNYFVSRTALRTEIMDNQLPLISENIYSEIQQDLLRPILISSFMATDVFLREWVVAGEKDESRIVRYLKEIQDQYDTVTSFFVSENTKIYYQAQGILKTVSPDNERDIWYFRVKEMLSEYEINIDIDMANRDTMTVFINYRVYDHEGKYIGATGVGLTVSAVKEIIETYQEGYEAYDRKIYFVDQSGNILLHGSGLPEQTRRITDMEGLAPLASEILSTSKNSFTYRKDGRSFLLNTRYLSEFNWYLCVEQSESKALHRIFTLLIVNIGICILTMSVVLFLTHLAISAYHKKFEEMATLDKLTGLYNRQAFSILFKEMIKEVLRRFIPFSVIIMDIDHFKRVNDTHGHVAGDAVLRHVASLMRTLLRESDTVCRWGGEEFMILMKECRLNDAFIMAEKIRKSLEDNPCRWSGSDITVMVSLGVSQWNLLDDRDEDSIVTRADKALYMAKEGGRNRTVKLA